MKHVDDAIVYPIVKNPFRCGPGEWEILPFFKRTDSMVDDATVVEAIELRTHAEIALWTGFACTGAV